MVPRQQGHLAVGLRRRHLSASQARTRYVFEPSGPTTNLDAHQAIVPLPKRATASDLKSLAECLGSR